MTLRKLLPGVFVVMLFLAACSPPPPLRDDAMLRDTSLSTSQPCAAPCWNGIIPGVTRWSDALTILEDDTTLSNVNQRNPQDEQYPNAAVIEFSRRDGSTCCQVITLDGRTVSTVFLRLAPVVTVGEVIANLGTPAYLSLSPYSDEEALVNLVYPDQATVIYAFVAGAAQGALSPGSEVIGVLYITPEDVSDLLQSASLHAWEGYETFAYYQEGEFEITPVPTRTPTPASP
jgi:hypothetical protein